ncbi:hypothetical protein ACO0K2_04345 [Undibacterium sp. MH2W]|uniref:hypothetical protein n=1 Tax=Undibacterium sp. MH2W TaxID=3413044 RepID=UPI003BF21799
MVTNETKVVKNGKKGSGTVARFRSVDIDGVVYLPGDTVILPADEIADLRSKGFLVDLLDVEVQDTSIPKVKITRGAGAKALEEADPSQDDQDNAESSAEDVAVKTSEE